MQTAERDALGFEKGDPFEQIGQRAPQAVESPHHQGIVRSQRLFHFGEPWSVFEQAAGLVAKNLLTSGLGELVALGV